MCVFAIDPAPGENRAEERGRNSKKRSDHGEEVLLLWLEKSVKKSGMRIRHQQQEFFLAWQLAFCLSPSSSRLILSSAFSFLLLSLSIA